MEPIDVYRTAKLLIDLHGDDAAIEAAMKADRCLDTGDLDGVSVWKGVIRAIHELNVTTRNGPLHS
jgi:hypothetical protein